MFDADNYFSDVDGDTLTYIATVADTTLASITFNANNEVIASTITPDLTGSTTVTIIASDGTLTAQDTFTLTVSAVSDGPVFNGPIADAHINEDSNNQNLFDADNYFTDADGDTLTYTLSGYNNALVSASLDANNNIIVSTATANMNGQTDITITASDGSSIATGTFTLFVDAVNDAPTVSTLPDQTIDEGSSNNQLFDLDNYFSDVDGDTLTYIASGYDAGLITVVVDGTNVVVTSAATPDGVVFTDVTITADDGTTTVQDTFRVTVSEVNDAPVLDAIGDLTGYVNTPFVYDVNASDADGDTLSYYYNTTLFNIDANTGVISFTPFLLSHRFSFAVFIHFFGA
jgi:hypothetical protein